MKIVIIAAMVLGSPSAAIAQSKSYRGPIIDAHLHVTDREARAFLESMEKENVEYAISMAYPGGGERLSVNSRKLVSLCDAEFVRPLAREDSATALSMAKRHIGKNCAGFGEVGVRHYNKAAKRDGGKDQPTFALPFRSEAMDVFLSHANTAGKPVVFHIEPFYDVTQTNSLREVTHFYEEVCRAFPNIKIVAAHNGMMPAKDLEGLFGKCKNFFSDFKFLTTKNSFAGFRDLHPFHKAPRKMREESDPIKPEWRALIGRHEDRFMFGSDIKTDQRLNGRRGDYSVHIQEVRDLISTFEPRLQQKIMYQNAKRVFNISN